jgi:Domain of unknown function (DUF4440)
MAARTPITRRQDNMKKRGPKRKNRKNASRSKRGTIDAVIRLEEQVWKAAQERNADEFKKLVPSDALMIFQSGIIPQPEYLATMKERTIARYELGRISGFMPNTSTVILHYEALRLGDDGGRTFPAGRVIESTTWVKRGRRWLAVLNQETPLRGLEAD